MQIRLWSNFIVRGQIFFFHITLLGKGSLLFIKQNKPQSQSISNLIVIFCIPNTTKFPNAWGITNLGDSTLFKTIFFSSGKSVQTPYLFEALTLGE